MPRLKSLPERVRYLQPFRKRFARRPDDLNEETGVGPLFALLRKRIEGCSTSDAEQILKEDGDELLSWLSTPEGEDDCLHFASVFLSMQSPSELVDQVLEEEKRLAEPQPFAEMDLSKGAKLRKDKLISFKGLLIALDPVTDEAAAYFADEEGRRGAGDDRVTIEVFPVRFGPVNGTKFVLKGESWRGPFKEIRYVLRAPGGHVYASAGPYGKKVDELDWDESDLEASLHTLRVAYKNQLD